MGNMEERAFLKKIQTLLAVNGRFKDQNYLEKEKQQLETILQTMTTKMQETYEEISPEKKMPEQKPVIVSALKVPPPSSELKAMFHDEENTDNNEEKKDDDNRKKGEDMDSVMREKMDEILKEHGIIDMDTKEYIKRLEERMERDLKQIPAKAKDRT